MTITHRVQPHAYRDPHSELRHPPGSAVAPLNVNPADLLHVADPFLIGDSPGR